jgi:choline dehydrogenase-like flavoprotein
MADPTVYDVVIVGAGVAGSVIAHQLGKAGKSVLVLESGAEVPVSREGYMERFYTQTAKTPESPYPNNPNAPRPLVLQLLSDGNWRDRSKTYLDQSASPLPFSSTYERRGGGTMWHWLGSSFRFLPADFRLNTRYGRGHDWPIGYDHLGQPQPGRPTAYYDMAETEIGVSADVADQAYHDVTFTPGYQYPNPSIPLTLTDQFFAAAVNDRLTFEDQGEAYPVTVYPTPAGRNSRPYDGRRVCAGNTNCIPICPIQAKYDPTVTLNKALNTGNVTVRYRTVASNIQIDTDTRRVKGIDYITYRDVGSKSPDGGGTARGRRYVLAAHAIETPRLLLNSRSVMPAGVANSSGQVGRNLMDHPLYLRWGLTPKPTFPYRGPLATAGIESLRDGKFRSRRAAFRVEFGNEGWNFAAGDPDTTVSDYVYGRNASGTNTLGDKGAPVRLSGAALLARLNDVFTRQFRFGYLVEQSAEPENRVTLSDAVDDLGIPRPKIQYSLSEYTKRGFLAARRLTDQVFRAAGVTPFAKPLAAMCRDAGFFTYQDPDTGEVGEFEYYGAGHVVGTYRMGADRATSVVDRTQRSWDHDNLFLVGSGVFPTVATGNPTLTIAALAFWATDTIRADLGGPA